MTNNIQFWPYSRGPVKKSNHLAPHTYFTSKKVLQCWSKRTLEEEVLDCTKELWLSRWLKKNCRSSTACQAKRDQAEGSIKDHHQRGDTKTPADRSWLSINGRGRDFELWRSEQSGGTFKLQRLEDQNENDSQTWQTVGHCVPEEVALDVDLSAPNATVLPSIQERREKTFGIIILL